MRKRFIPVVLLILTVLLLTACRSQKFRSHSSKTNEVAEILQNEKEAASEQSPETVSPADVPADAPAKEDAKTSELPAASEEETKEGIDIDLTKMSSNMVYSEVYNMITNPDDYIGKTVKMNGLFTTLQDPVTSAIYYGCIVEDATACCSSGIEFAPTDQYTLPDDLPENGGRITVVGTFSTYTEDDQLYCTLKEADFWKE